MLCPWRPSFITSPTLTVIIQEGKIQSVGNENFEQLTLSSHLAIDQ